MGEQAPTDEIAHRLGVRNRTFSTSLGIAGSGTVGAPIMAELAIEAGLADVVVSYYGINLSAHGASGAYAYHAGDAAKATEYTNAAEAFAAQLVTSEQSVEDLKGLHDQALQAAGQAKKAVEQNAMMLQTKIAERTKLLSQLEQAKMQEQVSASLRSMSLT